MKKIIPFSLLVLVIAVAVFYWLRLQPDVENTTLQVEEVVVDGVGTSEGKDTFSGVGTLMELQTLGKSLECQIIFERADSEGAIEGTYFTDKGALRGDFIVPAPEFGGTILSSMIVGGTSMYVWSTIDDDTFGFKSDITKRESEKVDSNEPVPLDAQIKYTCADWNSVDGSIFVPPANVRFQDLNTVLERGIEDGTIIN